MKQTFAVNDVVTPVDVARKGDEFKITIDGREYQVSSATLTDGSLNFFVGHRSVSAHVLRTAEGLHISLLGSNYLIKGEQDAARSDVQHHHGDGSIEAPMPGTIVSVAVKEGDVVAVGDPILILESMKMQNEITSPVSGEVTGVHCDVAKQVAFGEVLVEIQPKS